MTDTDPGADEEVVDPPLAVAVNQVPLSEVCCEIWNAKGIDEFVLIVTLCAGVIPEREVATRKIPDGDGSGIAAGLLGSRTAEMNCGEPTAPGASTRTRA